jgi:Uma2 family endonuclease
MDGKAFALPELRCTFGNRSTVPDIAIFTWNRIPLDDRDSFPRPKSVNSKYFALSPV